MRPRQSRSGGSAMAVALVFVVLCAAAAGATVTVARGWQSAASTEIARERAFQLAESAVDCGIARLRAARGVLPTSPDQGALDGVGTWIVAYAADPANGAEFTRITATGTSGGVSRTIQVLMRTPQPITNFPAATVFNVDAPILDVNGNAFAVDGSEHFLDGSPDPSRPAKWSVSSPAAPSALSDQVPSNRRDNFTGLGGAPAFGQSPPVDLETLVQESQRAATVVLTPGTHSGASYGTPVEYGTQIVSCAGDLHLSGGTSGAGILVVDGDLTITGGFSWVGIILVRGRVTMNGGGSTKRLIGALIVGDEVGAGSESSTLTVGGTIDLLYSTDAVTLAAQALIVPMVVMWKETGAS